MAVVEVPLANLDSVSDLMDWLAGELVTNHRFVEKRRTGDVAGDDITLVLERPNTETFHQDYGALQLLLEKDNNTDSTLNKAFSFNVAPNTYVSAFELVAPQTVTVDFDATLNRIVAVSGAFTNWVTAGYTTAMYVVVENAVDAGNNGIYNISSFTTTTVANDTLVILPVASNGNKDVAATQTGDSISVRGELQNENVALGDTNGGFVCSPRDNEILWNWPMAPMESEAPFLRARLITNPTSNSATPSEPLQFILIVETDTDKYVQMGFGEVVKLVGYTGGLWASGSWFDETLDVGNENNPFCQGKDTNAGYSENLNSNNAPFAVQSTDWIASGHTNANGRGWFLSGAFGSISFDAPTHFPMATLHYRNSLAEVLFSSPSAFSGQSERWPIVCFAGFGNKQYTSGASPTVAPMCVVPDIFIADITNVDAYSVFQDDFSEKFMVVPMFTKAGSGVGSTEKFGYLIRNPDLVVT
jgi:hypothetical protein